MKFRYKIIYYIIILLIQYFLLLLGGITIISYFPETKVYFWQILLGIIIPPLFTVLLYNILYIEINENSIIFSFPFNKEKNKIYFKELKEIHVVYKKGRETIESIKDKNLNVYKIGRFLEAEDLIKLWMQLSKKTKEQKLNIEIKRERI